MAVAGGEVEHPCRICPYLIEPGIDGIRQLKRPVGLTASQWQFLGLHGIAHRVEQLDVKDAAERRGTEVAPANHVCLVPDALALVI